MIEFKIYPNRKKDQIYWNVQVFDTKEEMLAHCKANCARFMGKKTAAICHCFFRVRYDKDGKIIHVKKHQGDIHFYKGRIGISIVSHECIHAGIDYVLSKRRKPVSFPARSIHNIKDLKGYWVSDIEEEICLAAGNLTRQVVLKFYEKGVWK